MDTTRRPVRAGIYKRPSANVLCGEYARDGSGDIVDVDTAQAPRVPSSSGYGRYAKTPLYAYKAHAERHSVAAALSNNDDAEHGDYYGRSARLAALRLIGGWPLTSRSGNKLQTAHWSVDHEATDCKARLLVASGSRRMQECWPRDCWNASNEAAAGEILLSLPLTLEAHCETMRLLAATAANKIAGGEGAGEDMLSTGGESPSPTATLAMRLLAPSEKETSSPASRKSDGYMDPQSSTV